MYHKLHVVYRKLYVVYRKLYIVYHKLFYACGGVWSVSSVLLCIVSPCAFSGQGVQCKELTLPASDLAYSACQVCVLPAIKEGLPTACLVVSPEGVVRYWPNIAYEASTLEVNAELKGEECACVVSFLVGLSFFHHVSGAFSIGVEISRMRCLSS